MFKITYVGGGGDDVVLTKVAAPATITVNGTAFTSINTALATVTQSGTVINVTAGYTATTEDVDLTTTNYAVELNLQAGVTLGSLKTKIADQVNLDGNSLTVGDTLKTTIAGNVIDSAGGGSLTKAGTGTLTILGNNTFTGTTTINAGSLQIGDGIYSGGLVSSVSLGTSSANLTFNTGSAGLTYSGAISGSSGTVTKLGAGTLILTANNGYGVATTVTGGTLQIGDGSTTGTGFVSSVTNNGVLAFDPASDNLTYIGVISGVGSVVKLGGNTLTFGPASANTYTGATSINGGILIAGKAGACGAAGALSVTVANTATLELYGTTLTIGGLAGGGTVENGGGSGVTLTVGGNSLTSTFSGILEDGGSGTLALTVSGGTYGAQALTGTNNAYSGATIISGGYLRVSADANLGNTASITTTGTLQATGGFTLGSSRVFSGNALIDVFGGQTLTYGGALTSSQTLTRNGGGTLILTGANTTSGTITINQGYLQIGDGGADGWSTSPMANAVAANGGALVFKRSDPFTYSGAMGFAGDLIQAGTDTVTLTNTNAYTGLTIINAGATLQVGAGLAAGASPGLDHRPLVQAGDPGLRP